MRKVTWGDVATLSVYLKSREARRSLGPREEGLDRLAANAGWRPTRSLRAAAARPNAGDVARVGELGDGPLRALRGGCAVGLPASDRLNLSTARWCCASEWFVDPQQPHTSASLAKLYWWRVNRICYKSLDQV